MGLYTGLGRVSEEAVRTLVQDNPAIRAFLRGFGGRGFGKLLLGQGRQSPDGEDTGGAGLAS